MSISFAGFVWKGQGKGTSSHAAFCDTEGSRSVTLSEGLETVGKERLVWGGAGGMMR